MGYGDWQRKTNIEYEIWWKACLDGDFETSQSQLAKMAYSDNNLENKINSNYIYIY